jgi:Ala-tRNA(Pro) deacylase
MGMTSTSPAGDELDPRSEAVSDEQTYGRLIRLLEAAGARYRLIQHAAEGRTEIASRYRKNPLSQAAKCIVVRIGVGKKQRRYLLAVVPGDKRVDLDELRRLYGGTNAAFAAREVAERLTGCVSGSIVPFSFNTELQLVVDRRLLTHDQLYFNAARLDRSVALHTGDYLALARPRIEWIAAEDSARPHGELEAAS